MLVVKVGGRALLSNARGIAEDISSLWREGKDVLLVHGGGDLVTEVSKRLGVEPLFVTSPEGIRSRYTSAAELEVYVMVMAGKVNKGLVSLLTSLGVSAVGLSGADGPTVVAERKKKIVVLDERGRKRVMEGGYTGKIREVRTSLLKALLRERYLPVVAPIAVDTEGTMLNVDGDQMAAELAVALGAESLVFLTDVEGLVLEGEKVSKLAREDLDRAIAKAGAGMNRKLLQAKRALEGGVRQVLIYNGKEGGAVRKALEGQGTTIS
ncbi:MAG: [LysW]-aminoadipate/[LysW]-glutamate kinase [Acidilobaceae archaeon]|nr:[LysW]-aminoadipate/[LysW]-glutamate kinase [Acidilobaceae archaeon]MDW7974585.1 [LysW]-aminoadipate/[LysW]-glutamate kinase [Sulfolobales archaeon]